MFNETVNGFPITVLSIRHNSTCLPFTNFYFQSFHILPSIKSNKCHDALINGTFQGSSYLIIILQINFLVIRILFKEPQIINIRISNIGRQQDILTTDSVAFLQEIIGRNHWANGQVSERLICYPVAVASNLILRLKLCHLERSQSSCNFPFQLAPVVLVSGLWCTWKLQTLLNWSFITFAKTMVLVSTNVSLQPTAAKYMLPLYCDVCMFLQFPNQFFHHVFL